MFNDVFLIYILCFSQFDMYVDVNRWKYDPERGLNIDTKNPQKACDKDVFSMLFLMRVRLIAIARRTTRMREK